MSDLILTEEQVEEWEAEKIRIDLSITKLRSERVILSARLRAVKILALDNDKISTKEPSGPTLVVSALGQSGKPMKPKEILVVLLGLGYDAARWGNNLAYLYTVLSRLIKSGVASKQDGFYSLVALEE